MPAFVNAPVRWNLDLLTQVKFLNSCFYQLKRLSLKILILQVLSPVLAQSPFETNLHYANPSVIHSCCFYNVIEVYGYQ